MSWTAAILPALGRWGYIGVGVGIFLESAGVPVPGETALIAASIAAANGTLSLPIVIAVACVASVFGDNIGFMLGRRLGRGWLESRGQRFGITAARLARVDAFFDRFGAFTVAAARFVAGVRVIVAFVAGTTRMRWRDFLVYNVLGAIAWASSVSLIAFGAARGYAGVAAMHSLAGPALIASVVVVAAVFWFVSRRRRSKGTS